MQSIRALSPVYLGLPCRCRHLALERDDKELRGIEPDALRGIPRNGRDGGLPDDVEPA